MKSLIFVVDRQLEVRDFASKCLVAAGYKVRAFTGSDADLEVGEIEPPSLIVIEIGLHHNGGCTSLEGFFDLSLSYQIPRLVVLDDSCADQRSRALSSGADDCIVKPFTHHELLWRVGALLRSSGFPDRVDQAKKADVVFDGWAMRLLVRGVEIPTTALEFRLLEYLARHRGQVFTRDFLLDAVWGDMRFINPRSVDACIRRIREKIELDRTKPIILKTIRGVGYRWDASAAWESAPKVVCDCPVCTAKIGNDRWESGTRPRRASAQGRRLGS